MQPQINILTAFGIFNPSNIIYKSEKKNLTAFFWFRLNKNTKQREFFSYSVHHNLPKLCRSLISWQHFEPTSLINWQHFEPTFRYSTNIKHIALIGAIIVTDFVFVCDSLGTFVLFANISALNSHHHQRFACSVCIKYRTWCVREIKFKNVGL